ncbi:MAG: immunity 53 family protein [Fibrobacterales bacterium]
MINIIERLQEWYRSNCNGDWEHSFGVSIDTLDNPGWIIKFDLQDTSLQAAIVNQSNENPNNPLDWYFIKTDNSVLEIMCGPSNLDQVLNIFFDEIIPKYSPKEFLYDIYLPLIGHEFEIWTPAKAVLKEYPFFTILEIPPVNYQEIKVTDLDLINFKPEALVNYSIEYNVGDNLQLSLVEVYDGVIQTPK